jgi:hypothetical protein
VVWARAVDGVISVERDEAKRRDVQEHKIPATSAVDCVESRVDAIRMVGRGFTGDL